MDLAIAGAIALSVILWILSGVAQYKHRDTAVIWTVYFAIMFTILVFFLTWQKREGSHKTPPEVDANTRTAIGNKVEPSVPIVPATRNREQTGETQPYKTPSPQRQNLGSGSGAPPYTSRFPHPGFKWSDYTEDYFYDAIWRWEYRPEMGEAGKEPRNVKGYCPDCRKEVKPYHVQYKDDGTLKSVIFYCDSHPLKQYQIEGHGIDPYGRIRLSIQRKLNNGQWQDVVKHQMDGHIVPFHAEYDAWNSRFKERQDIDKRTDK